VTAREEDSSLRKLQPSGTRCLLLLGSHCSGDCGGWSNCVDRSCGLEQMIKLFECTVDVQTCMKLAALIPCTVRLSHEERYIVAILRILLPIDMSIHPVRFQEIIHVFTFHQKQHTMLVLLRGTLRLTLKPLSIRVTRIRAVD
jgi:hypothetical protein